MPKQLTQDVLNQMRQIAQDTFEQAKTETSKTVGAAFEQLGGTTTKPPSGQSPATVKSQEPSPSGTYSEKEKGDFRRKVQISRLHEELEKEITKYRKIREQQLSQRREEKKEIPQVGVATSGEGREGQPPMTPTIQTSKQKKGLFGFWGKRVKSAQQQAQPELAGKRAGG